MKLLVAEDNRYFRRLLEINLKSWNHEVVGCSDGAEAWEILQKPDSPRLAILDWEMPKISGVELCRKIRSMSSGPYTYIILLTAKSRKEDFVEGLESGADDYIMKPFDPVELQVRVRAATRIVQLQEDLWKALREMEKKAKEDPLTGLWNHTVGLDTLKAEIDRAVRHKRPLGVIMTDIDHFKRINDTHGHLAGDKVIVRVAEAIRSSLRSYDTAARYGGDEFLIICPDCGETDVQLVAERIRESVINNRKGMLEFNFSVSLGAFSLDEFCKVGMAAAVRRADLALYAAKRKGRNRVMVWSAEIGDKKDG